MSLNFRYGRREVSACGKRGNWQKFDRVLAKVRDVPPLLGDEKWLVNLTHV